MGLAAKKPMKFYLPEGLNASNPPEARGKRRDHVRMLVLDRENGKTKHDQFKNLENYLNKGDLLVLNISRTLPASFKVNIRRGCKIIQENVEIRLAQRKSNSVWKVLVVDAKVQQSDVLLFSPSLTGFVRAVNRNEPLVKVCFSARGNELYDQLYRLGEPIRYEYINGEWSLEHYQTAYGTVPGSVEMASAGRAFSWEILLRLKKKGVQIARITLHTGLSYFLNDQWEIGPVDSLEEYEVPGETIRKIKATKEGGGKVVAVGTTVVRALESAVDSQGMPVAKKGWTNLHIHEDFSLKVVDALITGFHEPEASHLDMLSAFVPPMLLKAAYHNAIKEKYLWHEFGDMNLIISGEII
ncbi:S-adenosylmethionine:tRNA ribosyltransferase-isomerase [Pseudalkalibacillus salsuginis]|uniref:S-adenosylmethionine:tRNA ribosyltransferase-isomerase n=1 Tax=Pseudalkalibacillus salsuginis TaxID=2910972 RepID=UPI001F248971|nr:S-adenosylmethionine:tRNA ribosyltransferase-isomerase [Pseudalkalibacillus salsuginis]MCF6408932.1 S-adenosylmethionine:tRNA ribosyltransferase-isomerase [Pseudalkalibacillus salsuginis]